MDSRESGITSLTVKIEKLPSGQHLCWSVLDGKGGDPPHYLLLTATEDALFIGAAREREQKQLDPAVRNEWVAS